MCLYIGLKTLSYNFPKQHNVYLTTNASGFYSNDNKKVQKDATTRWSFKDYHKAFC